MCKKPNRWLWLRIHLLNLLFCLSDRKQTSTNPKMLNDSFDPKAQNHIGWYVATPTKHRNQLGNVVL